MTSVARAPRPAPRRRADAPARPDLYVVDGRRSTVPRAARSVAVLAVAVVVVFGSLLASAVFHSLLVTGQDRLDTVNTRIRAEREGLARDRLTLARAQSPERIAREARRLGMVPAQDPTWINPSASDRSGADGAGATDPADTTGADRTDERATPSGRGDGPDADTADADGVA